MCERAGRNPVEALTSAVDDLIQYVEEAPTAALGKTLTACRRQQDRLEAAFTVALGRFETNQEFAADGAASAASWLKANCRMSGAAAVEHLTVARQLEELPVSAQALADGSLGYQHAALIAKTASRVGTEAVLRTEADLLEAASTFNPNDFSRVTDRLRDIVDPDGFQKDANRAYDQRYLSVSQSLDGVFFIEGRLDKVGGATLRTAINGLTKPLPDDKRKPEQRRADALVELCRRQLDGGRLPEVGGQKPHLSVLVSAGALAGVPGAEAGTLEWGGVIPNATLQRLACDSVLSVIVTDKKGEPLDGGREVRIVPPALRRALVARDGGCRFPGCDKPIDWCDAHHLEYWTDGGPTTLNNLALTCPHHHHLVHDAGWNFWRDDKGKFHVSPPEKGVVRQPVAAARST